LVLTAPKVIEEIEQIKEIEPFKDEEAMTFVNDSSNPKDIIEQNTRQVSLGIENETVKELVDIVEEIDLEKNDSFELFDLIFISLISLASGGFLALIFIQLRNMKSSKTLEYDFDEAKDDKSMLSSIPQGLSIENNKDQQQFDLAVTYFEMNDQENAEKILADLIRVSKSNEIKTAASNLLKKLS
jgi:FimV-like protein